MALNHSTGPTKVVSFSGIDGAGKSTQIRNLRSSCERLGLRVGVITFWDDVAQLKQIRETAGHAIFKGDKGVGSPAKPILRQDKNVRSFPMTMVRLGLYLLDAISTWKAVRRARRTGDDLVIFDRYIYDELANLQLSRPLLRLYARLILRLVPRPHVSYLLDADPAQACARKPEYPVDFMLGHRQSYLRLSETVRTMTVVPALGVDDVSEIVARSVLRLFQPDKSPQQLVNELTLKGDSAAVPLDRASGRVAEL
jgi:thymidylate kinase